MGTVRRENEIRDYLAAIDDVDRPEWTPDGLDFATVTRLQWAVYDELRKEGIPEPTAWISMSDRERAEIRPPRRRTPAGVLRLVRGGAESVVAPDEGEAA